MKRIICSLLLSFLVFAGFSQTKVDFAKLVKTLETNKAADAEFSCDIQKSDFTFNGDSVVINSVVSKKLSFVLDAEKELINERLAAYKKNVVTVTFKAKDIKAKIYAVTKIDGIETVKQYKDRLAEEARIAEEKRIAEEHRLAEEARIKAEKERLANLTKLPVQVVIQESVNLDSKDASWLPGQIQDKLKSNLQDYVGMRTVVDAKSEKALLQLQKQSESAAHDEDDAIEVGKIKNAKFAVFTKLRKTNSGYTISVDFTDLTTGEQMASATSKEYSKTEYLYGTTGAVDELTVAIADKLKIEISEVTRNLLTTGSADFSVDAQMALAKQNEESYRRQQNNLDEEIRKLSASTDLASVENKKKLEAQKALLEEKQNAEKKRQQELAEQKKRADEDAKLEAERSIALKTQRDQMAKDAAAKAAEVRKLKMEKQGVLGQINVIESKKKALVEIRQGVELRQQELYDQLVKDRESEEQRIRNKTYSTVELGSDGQPTEQAKQRRENQVIKTYEDLTNKFFVDCDAVKKATASQDAALLAEIRADQKSITGNRTVSSMGDELKVRYGKYEGSKNGWNAYLSLYSDGILLYTDNFIVSYEALSGKKAPDMATELDDAVIEEYTNNVDMYNSLLTRGDPIIYFEIDYNVTAEGDDKPSEYKFNFSKIRVINTVSGKVTQTSALNKVQPRTMKPEWDLREIVGIVVEFRRLQGKPYRWDITNIQKLSKEIGIPYNKLLTDYFERDFSLLTARRDGLKKKLGIKMINIPYVNISMLNTEVTQALYISIMGENPSCFRGKNNPVEMISWYDAIYFCNKLSELFGFTPVYAVNGKTDVTEWNYTPHQGRSLDSDVTKNDKADGFRLPTVVEWKSAARGGKNFTYSGSDKLEYVGWYGLNSENRTHYVAQKEANGYGLYDMSGNVSEWCWDVSASNSNCRRQYGGNYRSTDITCEIEHKYNYGPPANLNQNYANTQSSSLGFRIVRSASN